MIKDYKRNGTIVLFEDVEGKKVSSTFLDHYKTFTIALNYLYEKGHKKIGYCIGRRTGTNSKQRELAYRDFLKRINRPFMRDYIIDNCLYFEDGEYVINKMHEMVDAPTALRSEERRVGKGCETLKPTWHVR